MSIKITVPEAGESVSEGEISKWYKKNNDLVAADEVVAELETEKASLEVRAPEAGKLLIKVEEGSSVTIGEEIGEIVESSEKAETKDSSPASSPQELAPQESVHSSPSVRSSIRENNINPQDITPTGKGGRITQEDLTAYNSKQEESQVVKPSPTSSFNEIPLSENRESRREKMSKIRRTIANRLLSTKNNTALLTTFNEVDMSAVMKIRKKYKDEFKEKHQVGLGYNSFFMKAASLALKAFPIVNSIIDGEELIFFNYEDIGIAVATPKGLVVPVVRDVGKKSFIELEKSILNFALKGRENKLSLAEMSGGTFTITNGGIFGSMLSTPIINYPQSAILGLHNIVERPVVVSGEIVVRPIMYVALTYDHRQIDGEQAVRFLVHIKKSIEDPAKLMLGL